MKDCKSCRDCKRRPLKLRIKLSKIKGVEKKTCRGCKHLVFGDLCQDYEAYGCDIHPEYDDISQRHRRCADYEKYVAPPYVERDTRCDLCEDRETCTSKVTATTILDSRTHYIPRFNGCPKDADRVFNDEQRNALLALEPKIPQEGNEDVFEMLDKIKHKQGINLPIFVDRLFEIFGDGIANLLENE